MAIAIFPLLLLVLLAFGAFAAVFIFRRRPRGPRVTEPTCAACGYCVRGIATLTCPECGADLREVGILTPTTSTAGRPLPFFVKALIWTLALPLPLLFFARITLASAPQTASGAVRRTIFSQSPALNDIFNVHFTGTTTAWTRDLRTPVPVSTLTVDRSGRSPITVDLAANTFHYTPPGGKRVAGTFDKPAFRRWLTDTGSDLTHPDASTNADAVYDIITRQTPRTATFGATRSGFIRTGAMNGAFPSVTAHSDFSTVQFTPHPASAAVITLAALATWAYGLLALYRRHRRATTSTSSPAPHPAAV